MADLVSITEAARMKECTRPTIYRAIKDGRLKAQIVGGHHYVIVDDDFHTMPLRQVEESLVKKVKVLQENVVEVQKSLREAYERIEALEKEVRGKAKESKEKEEKKAKEEKKGKQEKKGKAGKRR